MKQADIPTPYYIVYEDRLRRNFSLIRDVAQRSGAEIIMAFKANALWRTFPVLKDYCPGFTASSLNELRLGCETLGGEAHSYTPAYTDSNIDEFISRSTHITFNSLSQFGRFAARAREKGVSVGLRVNPKCAVVDTDLYNPALPGSRFGVDAATLAEHADELLPDLEGLHFHALCESGPDDLAKVLAAFEAKFGFILPQIKWVNMGGGHLMTREGYDTEALVDIIRGFRKRHPNLRVILEPGSAWMWRTGDLVSSVVDVVSDEGIKTAIIDVSFACHMPDTLEMPYKPAVTTEVSEGIPYRLGGNSCLSGDFKEGYFFPEELRAGDRLVLEDMNHYTNVKTTMFNGIAHPAVVFCDSEGDCTILRRYDYDDYRNRMC